MKQIKNQHKRDTKDSFIVKATALHGDKYDYSLVEYSSSKEAVVIICPTHQEFLQRPTNHLKGHGCRKCSTDNMVQRTKSTLQEFIEKSIKIYGDRYDYSEAKYINASTQIKIICKIHGAFLQIAGNHAKSGCRACGYNTISVNNLYTTEQFIEKANKVHNNFYDYSKADYIKGIENVTIICKNHGEFQKKGTKHLEGLGCPKCGKEKSGGFKRSDYIKRAKTRICTFYTLRCFNESEEFYKIGITMNTIKSRYRAIKSMPYAYEIVSEIYGEAGFIWDLELAEKRKLKEFNYQPNIAFAGSKRECFTQYTTNEAN